MIVQFDPVLVEVGLCGTADNQSTVTLTPLMTAVLEAATTVLAASMTTARRGDRGIKQRVEREVRSGRLVLTDAELRRRDVAVLLDLRRRHPLERGQGVLQGDEVALGGRIEQETVGRGSLAIGDRRKRRATAARCGPAS